VTGLPAEYLFQEYKKYFEYTLDEFCNTYSTCHFQNAKGSCVNSAGTHTKGHQNSNGRVIAVGEYESTFTYNKYLSVWMMDLEMDVRSLHKKFETARAPSDTARSDEKVLLRLHSRLMAKLYWRLGCEFINHSFCVCCFTMIAEYTLPCGHVLCGICIKAFSDGLPCEGLYRLSQCPLHVRRTSRNQWVPPCMIRFKPQGAGIRALSLDGSVCLVIPHHSGLSAVGTSPAAHMRSSRTAH
jgi:hypothetical protein